MATAELEENMEYLEKYKGTRRWLGKHHHRGKDHLAHMIRDKQVLTKSLAGRDSSTLTKRERSQLVEGSNDNFDFKVAYSLNKRNRWDEAKPVILLKGVPGSVRAEVVETYGGNVGDIFAVHSRENFDSENGSFDVRTAKSSGKGQSLSNFAPEARELSQKRPKKKQIPVREEKIDCGSEKLTVLYNISRPHPNKDVLYNEISQENSRHRTQTRIRPRGPKELQNYLEEEEGDVSDFDDESEQQEDEKSFDQRLDAVNCSIADFFLSEQKQTQKPERTRNRPISVVQRDESFEVLPEAKYTEVKELPDLNESFWFIEDAVSLQNIRAFDFARQVTDMEMSEKLDVRWIGDKKVVVNASKAVGGHEFEHFSRLFFVFHYVNKKQICIKISTTLTKNETHKAKVTNLMKLDHTSTLLGLVKQIAEVLSGPAFFLSDYPEASDYFKALDVVRDANWLELKTTEKFLTSERLSTLGVVQTFADMAEFVRNNDESTSNWPGDNSSTAYKRCHRCLDHSTKDTFLMSDGRFECTNCLRNEVFRQLRCGILPVSLDIALKEGQLVFDALPAILSLPMFVWYIKKYFAELYTAFGAGGKFSECPECAQSVYAEELGPEDTVRCGFCCTGWCIRCNCEPHWPMSCAEFAQWKPKWDIQYTIENPRSMKRDYMLEVRCRCQPDNETMKVIMPAEKVDCKNCGVSFGSRKMRIKDECIEYLRKGREDIEYKSNIGSYDDNDDFIGMDVEFKLLTPEIMAELVGRRIRREVAEPCGEARKRRTRTTQSSLLSALSKMKELSPEVRKLPSLFVTALQLVENVTGWAYVTKDTTGLAQMASRLLKHALTTVERLDFDADCQRTAKNVAVLEKMVNDVVAAARTRSQKSFDQCIE